MSHIQQNFIPQVRYLSEKATAQMLDTTTKRLQQDRFYRKGLPYVKFGKSVRYSLQDVVAYLEGCKVRHEG